MNTVEPIDPALYDRDDLRAALKAHQFGPVFDALNTEAGLSYREIGRRTGCHESVIDAIRKGRVVQSYPVLERITEGLAIPREAVGLGYGTYAEQVTVADPEGVEAMLRRHLLALGTAAAFGGIVPGVGELAPDMAPPGLPSDLPTRMGMVDVGVLRGYRDNLQAVARTYGGQARPAVTLAAWSDQWLSVDASDAVRLALLGELAHLHTITAWCCHDGGAPGRSLYHFGRAVELATDAGDSYQAAYALLWAGTMLGNCGRPNDALKAIQLGSVRLLDTPRDDPRVPVLESWCHAESAVALSRLDGSQARRELASARDGWVPQDTHATAKMHLVSALTWLNCGQLDAAEAAVTMASQAYGDSRRDGVFADLTRAQLHVMTGDPEALRLAESAITATTQTRSGVARQVCLPPLVDALDARPGTDARELARQARQVAATRA